MGTATWQCRGMPQRDWPAALRDTLSVSLSAVYEITHGLYFRSQLRLLTASSSLGPHKSLFHEHSQDPEGSGAETPRMPAPARSQLP